METITVHTEDEFVRQLVSDQTDVDVTSDGAAELWQIWSERFESGNDNELLVVLPPWYARDELDRSWPYLFAESEFDNAEKKAVLFDNARMVNINIVENEIWSRVTMTEAIEPVDITDDNDYIDEKGKLWIPRSLMTVFQREPAGDSLTGISQRHGGDD